VLLLVDPPALDDGEITDKGYVNARAVLRHRAAEVDRLYAAAPDPDVVVC
jgi:feruloyl-CoA synthase